MTQGYNSLMDADRQITMEEEIAATIFNKYGIAEQHATELGRALLLKVLAEFRPDLVDGTDQPEQATVLILSTAHLQEKTAARLEAYGDNTYQWLICHATGEYGWLVYVPPQEIANFTRESLLPSEFPAIFALARRLGCRYVRFDRDAHTYGDLLPHWDW